jgi:plasmid stabilization system protein ParE
VTESAPYELIILEAALNEILEQAGYYEEESGLELAMRWQDAVTQTLQSLSTMPHRGVPCFFRSERLVKLRHLSIKGFERLHVFYKAESDRRTLEIVAILRTARNIESILSEPRS